jgi:hypothetical protein
MFVALHVAMLKVQAKKSVSWTKIFLAFYFCWCSFNWFQLLFLEDENDHD